MVATQTLQPQLAITPELLRNFHSKIRLPPVEHADLCHLWVGAGRGAGYGAVKTGGKVYDSHVVAWRIANDGRPVPIGKLVMHTCHVKLCVRPSHLSLGTSSQNNADVPQSRLPTQIIAFDLSRKKQMNGAGTLHQTKPGVWRAKLTFRDGFAREFYGKTKIDAAHKLGLYKQQLASRGITDLSQSPGE